MQPPRTDPQVLAWHRGVGATLCVLTVTGAHKAVCVCAKTHSTGRLKQMPFVTQSSCVMPCSEGKAPALLFWSQWGEGWDPGRGRQGAVDGGKGRRKRAGAGEPLVRDPRGAPCGGGELPGRADV